eukprot:6484097-Pyramimonas_sp.AAC.1
MRGLRGSTTWTCREGMPNGSGGASSEQHSALLQGERPHRGNCCLVGLKGPGATIAIAVMLFSRFRLVALCISGLDLEGAGRCRSQSMRPFRTAIILLCLLSSHALSACCNDLFWSRSYILWL